MATTGGSPDVRDSSKDTYAGTGSGDMCWASTNTQEQNGRLLPSRHMAKGTLCLLDGMSDTDHAGYSQRDGCDITELSCQTGPFSDQMPSR